MEENIDRGMSTLIVFIIGAAILSAAQSVVTTGLNGIMNDFAYWHKQDAQGLFGEVDTFPPEQKRSRL